MAIVDQLFGWRDRPLLQLGQKSAEFVCQIMGKKTTAQKNQGECQKPTQCTWLRFTAGGTDRRLRPIVSYADL